MAIVSVRRVIDTNPAGKFVWYWISKDENDVETDACESSQFFNTREACAADEQALRDAVGGEAMFIADVPVEGGGAVQADAGGL